MAVTLKEIEEALQMLHREHGLGLCGQRVMPPLRILEKLTADLRSGALVLITREEAEDAISCAIYVGRRANEHSLMAADLARNREYQEARRLLGLAARSDGKED